MDEMKINPFSVRFRICSCLSCYHKLHTWLSVRWCRMSNRLECGGFVVGTCMLYYEDLLKRIFMKSYCFHLIYSWLVDVYRFQWLLVYQIIPRAYTRYMWILNGFGVSILRHQISSITLKKVCRMGFHHLFYRFL